VGHGHLTKRYINHHTAGPHIRSKDERKIISLMVWCLLWILKCGHLVRGLKPRNVRKPLGTLLFSVHDWMPQEFSVGPRRPRNVFYSSPKMTANEAKYALSLSLVLQFDVSARGASVTNSEWLTFRFWLKELQAAIQFQTKHVGIHLNASNNVQKCFKMHRLCELWQFYTLQLMQRVLERGIT